MTATPSADSLPDGDWAEERRRSRIMSLLDRIPPVHDDPGELHPDVTGWVEQLVAGGHPNLVLVGGFGAGKTWHAWHAALAALQAGWDGRVDVVTADDFRHRTAPVKDGSTFPAIVLMGAADLLVLDDVGAHRTTDWSAEALYAVVNRRYEQMLPTVITSNVADLRAELGERIASRLAQNLVVVTLDGPDRRRA